MKPGVSCFVRLISRSVPGGREALGPETAEKLAAHRRPCGVGMRTHCAMPADTPAHPHREAWKLKWVQNKNENNNNAMTMR